VRSATEVLRILTALPERERIELSRMLSTTGSVTDSQPAPVAEQADDDQSETATSVRGRQHRAGNPSGHR
jgi:hypothetical protein